MLKDSASSPKIVLFLSLLRLCLPNDSMYTKNIQSIERTMEIDEMNEMNPLPLITQLPTIRVFDNKDFIESPEIKQNSKAKSSMRRISISLDKMIIGSEPRFVSLISLSLW